MNSGETQEASDLLTYLVRPLKEIEKKMAQQETSLQSRIRTNIEQMDKCADEIVRMNEKLCGLEVEPRKHEVRISAVEGQAQHVEPLVEEVRKLSEVQETMAMDWAFIPQHSEDLRLLKRSFLEAEKRVASHDINHQKKEEAIAKDCQRLRDEFLETKEALDKEIKGLRHSLQEGMNQLRLTFNRELSVVPSFQNKVDDVNRKFENNSLQVNEKLNNSYTDLINKYEELKQNLNYTSDNLLNGFKEVKFKVAKEEHNYENFQQQVEILEMRCDKLATMIKKLQAEKE